MSHTDQLIAECDASIFPTYARYPVVIADGNGCRLTDAEGKTYLDFLSGLAVNALGYRHPALVQAFKEMSESVWRCALVPFGPAKGPLPRTGSPLPGISTFITSAPRRARFMEQKGPARYTVTAKTLMSFNGSIDPRIGGGRSFEGPGWSAATLS